MNRPRFQLLAGCLVGEGVGIIVIKPVLGLLILRREMVLKKLDEHLVKLPRAMHRAMDMPRA